MAAVPVANAAALLDYIQSQLGTQNVALQIFLGAYAFALPPSNINDSSLAGITSATISATIIAYSGNGSFKADYLFGTNITYTTTTDQNGSRVMVTSTDSAGNQVIVSTRTA